MSTSLFFGTSLSQSKLSRELQLEALKILKWQCVQGTHAKEDALRQSVPFFQVWHTESQVLNSTEMFLPSVEQLLQLLSCMVEKAGNTKAESCDTLRRLVPSVTTEPDEYLGLTLDLAVRFWLMINVRDDSGSNRVLESNATTWTANQSLSQLLASQFVKSKSSTTARKFSSNLTVRNLVRIGGFRIVWTNNLADHLFLTTENKRLHIFHHTTFLRNILETNKVFPPGLIEETLQTIALLMPWTDPEGMSWLEKVKTKRAKDDRGSVIDINPDYKILGVSDSISHYEYWRDRLEIIEEVFNRTQPTTLTQLWLDRRNKVQWATFWIAGVVFFLTLIQCVTGIIQAWASLRALR